MGHFIVANVILLGVLSILTAVALMLLVRKVMGLEFLREHHPVSDPLLACVGTLFAILLGFMVANAMTRFEEARTNVEQEAGAVGDIYRLASGLPGKTGVTIRSDCFKYLDGVVDVEWKEMANRNLSFEVWNGYSQIWADCLSVEPVNDRENNIHATLLSSVATLGDCLRIRATQMSNTVPVMLWTVVLMGAMATGTLVLFFGISNLKIQTFTTSLVTLVLYLNVVLLACYDEPFSGEVCVKPHAFKVARQTLGRHFSDQETYMKLLGINPSPGWAATKGNTRNTVGSSDALVDQSIGDNSNDEKVGAKGEE
ncbi:MAG: hypothetical protein SGJ27_17675 [Candidatus Melainabacteria bacterium]|nr:hypothetical protein [Candidatus Melainabacteria bacterium]